MEGFKPPDEKWQKMAEAYRACEAAGVRIPPEVEGFFENGAPDPNSCKGLGSATPGHFDGAHFRWLSANVIETATGRTLLPARV